jgi:feruloyl esterase
MCVLLLAFCPFKRFAASPLLPFALLSNPSNHTDNFAVASTDTGHHGTSADGYGLFFPLPSRRVLIASSSPLSPINSTFAAGNPESQIDFGYRAVHLSTVYSKAIVEVRRCFLFPPFSHQILTVPLPSQAYYGEAAKKSYWLGCSSGGKQGLKEVQAFPEDYDGVIAGAAA